MKYLSITFFLFLAYFHASSQQNWTNYSNDRIIHDIQIVGNDVWIGSQGGLTRTNIETGEFETFLASNSPIKGGGITEVEQAPDGSMWFGSENAGIFHYKDGEWTNYFDEIITEHYYSISHLQIIPNGDVWFFVDIGNSNRLFRIREGVVSSYPNIPDNNKSFCVTDENTVYIGYYQAVYKYDVVQKAIVETWHVDNSIIDIEDSFTEIVADKEGGVLLPSHTRLLRLKEGSPNGDLTVLDTTGLYTYITFQDEAGNAYMQPTLNDPNGIRLIKYDGNELTYYKDEDFGNYPIDKTPIFSGVDAEGSFYATFYSLDSEFIVYRFVDNEWLPVESQIYPITFNYQTDVQADCDGNLWFGGLYGVDVKYTDGTWGHFDLDFDDNRSFFADDMTIDPITCDVWFSNRGNSASPEMPGIVRISDGEVTGFLYNHANIQDIEANIDGKVYFYSILSGFGYIENDEVVLIDEFEKYESIHEVVSDSKGNIYIGTGNYGLVKYDGDYFDYLGTGGGSNTVYKVFVDNDDFVWVRVSADGLKQFDGINWHSYPDLKFSNDVTGMVQDQKGNYWIATWFDGLYYWNKETFQNYNIQNSDLSSNDLRSLAFAPEGNLIVTQNVGASVLSIPNNQRNFKGSGTVFYDDAQNGLFEEGTDILVPGQKVKAAGLNVWAITNPDGKYSFYSDVPETFSFLYQVDENSVSTTDNPQLASITDNSSVLPDFGFWRALQDDIDINISNGVPVCNRDFKVYINLRNRDIGEVTGHLILKHNNFLTILDSSIPISQQSDGEIVFENITLENFKGKNIHVTVQAPGIGADETNMFFEATFETASNQFQSNTSDQILCSYDPNDKKVEATGEFKDDFSLTKDAIKYTIRFQNEGTYKAFDIAIIDTLDSNLDPSTFELLGSSHRVETNISEVGIVTFNFLNIDLPTKDDDELGSQGFVAFKINPYPDTENFTVIHNSAGIYFDFNPPIITNTTEWNVVDDLSLLGVQELDNDVLVFPNPSDGLMQIKMEEESSYRIMDISGKLVKKGAFSIGLNDLNLDVTPGVYLLHLDDSIGSVSMMKLVVF